MIPRQRETVVTVHSRPRALALDYPGGRPLCHRPIKRRIEDTSSSVWAAAPLNVGDAALGTRHDRTPKRGDQRVDSAKANAQFARARPPALADGHACCHCGRELSRARSIVGISASRVSASTELRFRCFARSSRSSVVACARNAPSLSASVERSTVSADVEMRTPVIAKGLLVSTMQLPVASSKKTNANPDTLLAPV